jgi:hypothetical protein
MTAPVVPGGPRFPPLTVPWDGDPARVRDAARQTRAMRDGDYDAARVDLATDTVMDLVRTFLDCSIPFDDVNQTQEIPPSLYQACVLATVEGYRRKDATFGLAGSFTADGIPVRITNDWLAPVLQVLAPLKQRFGLA